MTEEEIMKLSPSYFHLRMMERARKSLAFSPDVDFKTWQRKLRRKLKQLLGPIYKDEGKVEYKVLEEEDKPEYSLRKISFYNTPDVLVLAYLLVPKEKKAKYPAMVCLQGHSPGAHISIGRAYNKEDEENIAQDRDFAIQAVKNGYVALAIEQRAFGERREKLQKMLAPHTCHDAVMHALMLGHTFTAERIADVMRGIDLLYQLPIVDRRKIGCMGESGGGTVTFYASCIEPRITLSVVICAFCTYEDSIMTIYHCADNYIPGALQYFGEEDLAGLIAPRPFVIVAGEQDPIFPIHGVRKAYEKAKLIYEKAGYPERVQLVVGPGGHRNYADLAWPVINKLMFA